MLNNEQKLLACIHCGLCLEACPTYVITGDENDGPRGRLYLMRAVAEDRLPNTSNAFRTHINRCLGCRACEQVCPAGVEYGQLLEASREELTAARPAKGVTQRLLRLALRHVWPWPRRLSLFFTTARVFRDLGLARLVVRSGLARVISSRAEFALALLDSSRGQRSGTPRKAFAPQIPAGGVKPVQLFTGCVGQGLFARVNEATRRVLEVNGCAVEVPPKQVCCGALHAHAGDLEGARNLARRNLEAFAGSDNVTIVTNAGGCGAMLESYAHLLAEDESLADAARHFSMRVRDVGQELQGNARRKGSSIGPEIVTYDASCHLLYGQHAAEASANMLREIPDLNFASLEGSERCCGGAGVYNLLQPELSGGVLQEKLKHVSDTKAEVLATGNPGCHMQIGAGALLSGMTLRLCHPVELLDESYQRAGLYESAERR